MHIYPIFLANDREKRGREKARERERERERKRERYEREVIDLFR